MGAVCALALGAGPASADTSYPGNITSGSAFDSNTDGWADTTHSCVLDLTVLLPIQLPIPGCTVTNTWDGGNNAGPASPSGSLKTSFTSPVNALGLIVGTSLWTSPTFAVTGAPTGGTFALQRKADVQALLDLGAAAQTTVFLVDETAATSTVLLSESVTDSTVNAATPTFQSRSVTVPPALLTASHSYHLNLQTQLTSSPLQAALGIIDIYYDNAALRVHDGTDTGTVPAVVATLDASGLTSTGATLNGSVDAKGLATTYSFEYGTTTAYGTTTTPDSGGSGNGPVTRSTAISGLTACTIYHYRVRAANAINAGTDSLGNDVTFATDCKPTAHTLPAGAVVATSATLNSSVNPNGPVTTYYYEWGTTTAYTEDGSGTTPRSAGSGRQTMLPLSEPISGLSPSTTYHYRVVASNALGVTLGDDVTFVTPAQSGPGPTGSNGANGSGGPTGAAGPVGKPGTPGKSAPTNVTLANGSANAFLTIRSRVARIGLKGRRRGQIRLPIFCSQSTGRTCAGTVKIRTIGKINPSTRGLKKTPRKVTLATFEYQLAAGKKGYAISTSTLEKLNLMERLKSVKVLISVQVADAAGNKQTITQKGTFIAQTTV